MTDALMLFIAIVLSVVFGGVIVPLVLNWLCDKWGWFK
jgi:hypothetical protein